MKATKTQKGEASTPPKIEAKSQAVVTWKHGESPGEIPDGAHVLTIGQDTGRKNKLNQPILSKSLVIATPNSRTIREGTNLTEEQAMQKQQAIGTAIKPMVMARVGAAGASSAFIVRRYSETPGKRDKLSVTLERVNVESTVAKLAREYNMTEDEVRKRLNIPVDSTSIPV